MTIEEAREILGKDYESFPDDKIKDIMKMLSILIENILNKYLHSKLANHD